jgi:hypothetical protein
MHRADPGSIAPIEPHGLGILWAKSVDGGENRRRGRSGQYNFAIGAMVNGGGAANALKTLARCNSAMRVLRLSRHTQR